jgi:uncharacterized protein with von Willebrand factor type A (vWA) domain
MIAAGAVRDVVGFVRALRAAGLRVGIDQSEGFGAALDHCWLAGPSRRELYLAARVTLVSRCEDLPLFDEVFGGFFGALDGPAVPQKMPLAPRHDRDERFRTALVSYMAERARANDPEVDVPEIERAASPTERLARKDFTDCTVAERDAITRAMREMDVQVTRRPSLRLTPARSGYRLDLPAIMRRAARLGGVALSLPRRKRKIKERPLVVLADISGSMELYSRLLLQFFHGLTHRLPKVETFVFGTRLTRLTAALQIRDVDAALDHAGRAIEDFAGGTRISDCLAEFNRLYARRVVRGGAVVLLVSDGWETGDTTMLAAEMARLQARSHRLVWLNPLLGRDGYEPRVAGMSVALGHVDDFLPVHNLQSLQQLSLHLSRIPRRKGALSTEVRR